MKQMSHIEQAVRIIKANMDFNYHWYDCAFLQEGTECNCDNFSDLEIATKIFESYGYKLIKDNDDRECDISEQTIP